jgi:hypothetical protein
MPDGNDLYYRHINTEGDPHDKKRQKEQEIAGREITRFQIFNKTFHSFTF